MAAHAPVPIAIKVTPSTQNIVLRRFEASERTPMASTTKPERKRVAHVGVTQVARVLAKRKGSVDATKEVTFERYGALCRLSRMDVPGTVGVAYSFKRGPRGCGVNSA